MTLQFLFLPTLLMLLSLPTVTYSAVFNPLPSNDASPFATPDASESPEFIASPISTHAPLDPATSPEARICPQGYELMSSRDICLPIPPRLFSPPRIRACPKGAVVRHDGCVRPMLCRPFFTFWSRPCAWGKHVGDVRCPPEFPVVVRGWCFEKCPPNYQREGRACVGLPLYI